MRARSAATADAELLASAVALRWSRPDLTAALAEHVAATWAADDRTWVAAAGWLVHGRAAVGDGRECASDTLAELARRDPALLDDPAADRLRIEVATLAAAQCEPAVARLLVEPLGDDRPAGGPGRRARCAGSLRVPGPARRCRRGDPSRGRRVGERCARSTPRSRWRRWRCCRRRPSGGPGIRTRPSIMPPRAWPGSTTSGPAPSAPHLAAALAAEWITALVEAGRIDDARAGCDAMADAPRSRRRGPPDRPLCCGSPWPGRWPRRPRRVLSRRSNRRRRTLPSATRPISKVCAFRRWALCTSRPVGWMRRWSRCAAGSRPSDATGPGRSVSVPRCGRYL